MRFVLKVLGLTVFLTIASWFLFAKRTDDEPQLPQRSFPQEAGPPEIDLGVAPLQDFPRTQLSCSLDLRYGVPQVELHWSMDEKHPFAKRRENGSQAFATDYWPNTGLWLSQSVLVVAGVTRQTQQTILERWTFEVDSKIPRAEWVGAEVDLAWLLPERNSVERIYEGNEPGRGPVQALIENFGQPGTLFASFRDSNELYSIADGRAHVEPLGSAPNSKPLSLIWLEETEGEGFTYTLFHGPRNLYCGSDLNLGTLTQVLDEDGDGRLDRVLGRESD